jgi:polysaccharide chain length determinant protein (PEP-CTERM system associated)
MQQILTELFGYLWGAWRYRWVGIFTAWAIAIAAWAVIWKMPEAYVASARVYVDTSSVLRPLLRGLAIQPDINERVNMMSRTLLSRPNLEKLMRMTDLDLQVTNDEEQEEKLDELREAISLVGDLQNPSLYSIKVVHSDRDLAKSIAQSLITVFIDSSLSGKREDSSGAQNFLDEQISEYEKRLIDAENRLAQFKQSNMDLLPGSGGDYYTRLQNSRAELTQARLLLSEMESRKRELERQVAGEDPVFLSSGISPTESMSPIDVRIQSLKGQLDSLLTRYTDNHPEVRQLRSMIRDLEREKMAEYGRAVEGVSGGYEALSTSSVYQGMRTMLAQADAEIAELQIRAEEYEKRVDDLNSKVNTIPEVEARLKQLNRDYEVVSSQHQEMLQRRESARLSEDLEQSSSDVIFRVIEPPFVPTAPSEPDKLLLNAAALVLSVLVGAGVAFLISLINPVISNTRTLMNVAGFPTLGVVPYHQSPEEKRKELYGSVVFASLSAGLLLMFFGLAATQGLVVA